MMNQQITDNHRGKPIGGLVLTAALQKCFNEVDSEGKGFVNVKSLPLILNKAGMDLPPNLDDMVKFQSRINNGEISFLSLCDLLEISSSPLTTPNESSKMSPRKFKDDIRALDLDRRFAKVRGFRLIPSPNEDIKKRSNSCPQKTDSAEKDLRFNSPPEFKPEVYTHYPVQTNNKNQELKDAFQKVEIGPETSKISQNPQPNKMSPKESDPMRSESAVLLLKDMPSRCELMSYTKEDLVDKLLHQMDKVAKLNEYTTYRELIAPVFNKTCRKSQPEPRELSAEIIKEYVKEAIAPLVTLINTHISRPCLSCGLKHISAECPWDPQGILQWQPRRNVRSRPKSHRKKSTGQKYAYFEQKKNTKPSCRVRDQKSRPHPGTELRGCPAHPYQRQRYRCGGPTRLPSQQRWQTEEDRQSDSATWADNAS